MVPDYLFSRPVDPSQFFNKGIDAGSKKALKCGIKKCSFSISKK
jgi:hypothetical protein